MIPVVRSLKSLLVTVGPVPVSAWAKESDALSWEQDDDDVELETGVDGSITVTPMEGGETVRGTMTLKLQQGTPVVGQLVDLRNASKRSPNGAIMYPVVVRDPLGSLNLRGVGLFTRLPAVNVGTSHTPVEFTLAVVAQYTEGQGASALA